MRRLRKRKKWYMDAVKSYLILHLCMSEKDARRAIRKYHLRERINRFPDIQMHYSIRSTVEEMMEEHCIP